MCNFEELSRKRARRFFTVKNLTLPVDIENIVKDYADVEEDFIPCDGDAICINNKGRPLIVLRKNVPDGRKRFTLAHELGHIQIPWHIGMLSCHTDEDDKIDLSNYYQMEREANIFAAELLMPQSWLKDLVDMKKDLDIKELLDIISEQAQVSFSAALYNLINVIPIGYILYIENKKQNYYQRKTTGNSVQPVFLYDENNIDFEWIAFNSYQDGTIKHEILNVYWYKYKNILNDNVIDISIKNFLKEYNLSDVLMDIIDINNSSVAFTLKLLLDKLMSGYIVKILFIPTGTYNYLVSPETYVNPKGIKEKDVDDWYDKYCEISGEYKEKSILIRWWYFKTAFDFHTNNDKRDSKLILKIIINDYYSGDERKSIYGRVNGIIGNLNNGRSKMELDQFYSILRQKFLGYENLQLITSHKDFNQFLVKKTLELYKI